MAVQWTAVSKTSAQKCAFPTWFYFLNDSSLMGKKEKSKGKHQMEESIKSKANGESKTLPEKGKGIVRSLQPSLREEG